MGLSDGAERLFQKLAAQYAGAGFPGRNMCGFNPDSPEERRAMQELRAHGLLKPKNMGGTFEFTEDGERVAVGAVRSGAVHIHTGPSVVNTISNSNVGAFASGGSNATGSVHVESTTFDQAQHEALMKKAKHAMVEEEDKLDAATNEALWKLLRMASETKIAVAQLAADQAKLKDTADDLWAKEMADGMKPQALSSALEVVKVLLSNPLTAAAVKGLLGGG